MEEENTLDLLQHILREQYLAKNTFTAPGLDGIKVFHIAESYVNLALLHQSAAQHEPLEYGLAEDSPMISSLVALPQLFTRLSTEVDQAKPIEKILILGRAGIGKTTLCHYLAYQWAKGNLLRERFDYLFWVSLKSLDTDTYCNDTQLTVTQWLYDSLIPDKYRDQLSVVQFRFIIYQKRCLFLLDGFDEVTHLYHQERKEANAKVLTEALSQLPYLLMTSRPTQIDPELERRFDRRMENRGFTDHNILTYLSKFFKEPVEQDQFTAFLQQNPSIYGIAYIPLNLFLLCDLWQQQKEKFSQGLTLTRLYQNFLIAFLNKHAKRLGLFEQEERQLRRTYRPAFEQLEAKFAISLEILSQLAYDHLFPTVQLIIPHRALTQLLNQVSAERKIEAHYLLDLGFIKPTHPDRMDTDYYFIHKTFQEFFAARYVCQALKAPVDSERFKTAIHCLQHQKYHPAYAVVFWFTMGLWHAEKDPQPLQYGLDALLTTAPDWVGLQQTILMLHGLEQMEMSDRIGISTKAKLLEDLEQWIAASLLDIQPQPPLQVTIQQQLGNQLALCPRVANAIMPYFQKHWATFSPTEKLRAFRYYLTPLANVMPDIAVYFVDWLFEAQTDSTFLTIVLSTIPWQRLMYSKEKLKLVNWLVDLLDSQPTELIVIGCISALGLIKVNPENKLIQLLKTYIEQGAITSLYAQLVLSNLQKMRHQQWCENIIQKLHSADEATTLALLALIEFSLNFLIAIEKTLLIEPLQHCLTKAHKAIAEKAARILNTLGQTTPEVQRHLWRTFAEDKERKHIVIRDKKLPLETQRLIALEQHLIHPDNRVKVAAVEGLIALQQIKPEAIELLLKVLRDHNWDARKSAAHVLGQLSAYLNKEEAPAVIQALLKALRDDKWQVRQSAAKALGQLGGHLNEKVRVVMKMLWDALRDDNGGVCQSAAQALGQLAIYLNKEKALAAIQTLLKALRAEDENVRQNAAQTLGELGAHLNEKTTSVVIEALLKTLRDHKWQIRQSAAKALGQLGGHLNEKVPVVMEMLLKTLRDNNWGVCQSAAQALGQLVTCLNREEALAMIQALLKALRDDKWQGRQSAAKALGQLGGHLNEKTTPVVIEALLKALRDEDEDTRLNAAQALGKLGAHLNEKTAPVVIEELLKTLRDENEDVRQNAAQTLGELGAHLNEKTASVVIEELLKTLRDDKWNVRPSAAQALGQLGTYLNKEKAPVAIEALFKALEDENGYVCQSVAQALGQLGAYLNEKAPAVIGALFKALGDKDENVCQSAAQALKAIGKLAESYFARLLDGAYNYDADILIYVLPVLGNVKISQEKQKKLTVDNLWLLLPKLKSDHVETKIYALKIFQRFYQEKRLLLLIMLLRMAYEFPQTLQTITTLLSNLNCRSKDLLVVYQTWVQESMRTLQWRAELWQPLIERVCEEGTVLSYHFKKTLVLQNTQGEHQWILPNIHRSRFLSTLQETLQINLNVLKLPSHDYQASLGLTEPRYPKISTLFFPLPKLASVKYAARFNSTLWVDYDHFALSLIRRSTYPHVLILIEGMTIDGKALLQRIDFTTTGASQEMAKIELLNVETLQTTLPHINIEASEKGAVVKRSQTHQLINEKVVMNMPCYGFVWKITREQFEQLLANVKTEQQMGEHPYSQYGIDSIFSSNQNNCLTWSRRHLTSLNHSRINQDLKSNVKDNIAADPDNYLTQLLTPELVPERNCLIM